MHQTVRQARLSNLSSAPVIDEEILRLPNTREAMLTEQLSNGRVRCRLCERRCVTQPGQMGRCKARMNIDGKLHTLVYGNITSVLTNAVEKKPFFHFWPGSHVLTVGSWGCAWSCPWCHNWEVSKYPPQASKSSYVNSEDFVGAISRQLCQGTSQSFNEPTLNFEYSLDIFPLAKERGFFNTICSNGYMTLDALKLLKAAGLDAISFNVKGNKETVRRYCDADVDVVWRNIRVAKKLGMHVEIVNLVVPGVNDDEGTSIEIAERCLKEVGPDVPLHFTQFYPAYKMTDRSQTPISTLERARELARKQGIHYVYLGNVHGHKWESTYCHNCGRLLVERYLYNVPATLTQTWGSAILKYKITEAKRCPACNVEIPILGRYVGSVDGSPLIWDARVEQP
jgi:pyruvate formate lyase activating enzyme